MRTLVYESRRVLVGATVIAAFALAAVVTLSAQEQEERQPTRRGARGRLPNFYTQVVSRDQREKIYAVQKQYAPEIDKIRKQLQEVIDKRDKEIRDLLTPEQQKRVDELRAEARKRREANRARRRQGDQDQAAPAQEDAAKSP